MQGHVALEFHCSDLESTGWDYNDSTPIVRARIDSRLNCIGVDGKTIPFGPEGADVVGMSVGVVTVIERPGLGFGDRREGN
jgi:hypothetical protein